MGIFSEIKKLARPYDEEDEEYEEFAPKARERAAEAPKPAPKPARSSYTIPEDRREDRREGRDGNKVVNIHATTQLSVVLVKPDKFENAAGIADHLREKRTVVLNLEETNKDIARRLIDFLSGVAYAQDGKIKKIAINTFLITPYNVDLLGDLLDELENNGVFF